MIITIIAKMQRDAILLVYSLTAYPAYGFRVQEAFLEPQNKKNNPLWQ